MIDEYADYSREPDIQNAIKTIVRKAGYVNIHVIVCTQRADARNTIPPEVKANLGATLCFTTKDKANSLNILDMEGAEQLGGIEGRAILLDGDKSIIQVPLMTYRQCKRLLNPFKERKENVNQDTTGCSHNGISEKVQNMLSQSAMSVSIQREQQPRNNVQPSNEKTGNGWFRL